MDVRQQVAAWADGRASVVDGTLRLAPRSELTPRDRARAAYRWLAREAVWSPHDDLVFGDSVVLEGSEVRIELHDEETYASFLLLPLLNLMVGGRLLFVGAPGRGKTTVATMMGLLAGGTVDHVRRLTQRGHPQLSVADLLGAPLPRDLVEAHAPEDVRVAWRRWLSEPVKIVDELNRIPTKTQSALLSLMAEGCAEAWEQMVEVGRSAWFFTANDELGGGTFPLIDALRDRIDVVVRCPPFPTHRMAELARTDVPRVPDELQFSSSDLHRAESEIDAVAIAPEVHGVLAFLTASLGFCRRASDRLGGMTKDTLLVAGSGVRQVCTEDCPLDKTQHLCARVEQGPSVRAVQAVLRFARALAWFRGRPEVGLEEVRAVLPWAWHDRVRAVPHSRWLSEPGHAVLRQDHARFLGALLADAESQYVEYRPIQAAVDRLCQEAARRSGDDIRTRIETQLRELVERHELCGPVHVDLLRLQRAWQELR